MNFLDRLYYGYEAEHHVMGELFGAGYEAFRLPGDFGYDVVITNQKEISRGPTRSDRSVDPPYALQVKSRRIQYTSLTPTGPSNRLEGAIDFLISEDDIALLQQDGNQSFLVLVIFIDGIPKQLSDKIMYCWFSGKHVSTLNSLNYFVSTPRPSGARKDFKKITCSIRLTPLTERVTVLDKLEAKGDLSANGRKELESLLPEQIPGTWGREYLSLLRERRSPQPPGTTTKMIPEELTILSNIGKDIGLGTLN